METSKVKNWIILGLIFIIALLSTCEYGKIQGNQNASTQDTLFLSQWRREKKEKQNLIKIYEQRLTVLKIQKDSLESLTQKSKENISHFRSKAQLYQNQFRVVLKKLAHLDSIRPDTLSPLLDSLVINQQSGDSACDRTITLLENNLANRDSSLQIQKHIEESLRDLNKEGDLRNQFLSEQLNTAYKTQKRKARQNKILAGGLLILSGITTSLLLTQSLK